MTQSAPLLIPAWTINHHAEQTAKTVHATKKTAIRRSGATCADSGESLLFLFLNTPVMHDHLLSKLDFPPSSQSQVTNRPSTVMKARKISAKVKRHSARFSAPFAWHFQRLHKMRFSPPQFCALVLR